MMDPIGCQELVDESSEDGAARRAREIAGMAFQPVSQGIAESEGAS